MLTHVNVAVLTANPLIVVGPFVRSKVPALGLTHRFHTQPDSTTATVQNSPSPLELALESEERGTRRPNPVGWPRRVGWDEVRGDALAVCEEVRTYLTAARGGGRGARHVLLRRGGWVPKKCENSPLGSTVSRFLVLNQLNSESAGQCAGCRPNKNALFDLHLLEEASPPPLQHAR